MSHGGQCVELCRLCIAKILSSEVPNAHCLFTTESESFDPAQSFMHGVAKPRQFWQRSMLQASEIP